MLRCCCGERTSRNRDQPDQHHYRTGFLFSCEEKEIPGTNYLLEILEEPIGENCINGGSKIVSGIDANSNGEIDGNEIENTFFICNGKDGLNTLTDIIEEPPGENCRTGGYMIISGLDLNRDSILNVNEIQNLEYLCNGEDRNEFSLFCDVVPEGWYCQVYQYAFNTLPGLDRVDDDPLAIISYSNSEVECTGNKALYLYAFDIAMKETLETIIEESAAASSCVPMFFGENEKYYIVTSPCYLHNGCWTTEKLAPLYQSIKSLFTSSIIN